MRPLDQLTIPASSQQDKIFLEYSGGIVHSAGVAAGAGTSALVSAWFIIMTYAIFQTGGKQYRVSRGESVDVERLDVETGSKVVFNKVFLTAVGGKVAVGSPVISGAAVTAGVVEQYKGRKVTAYKFKRRKGYHRTVGHRRRMTRLKILEITLLEGEIT
jgi:large subunit ribosomal protein L21